VLGIRRRWTQPFGKACRYDLSRRKDKSTLLTEHQDQFSTNPKVRALLSKVKKDKEQRKAHDEAYYHDDRLDELLAGDMNGIGLNGNGVNGRH